MDIKTREETLLQKNAVLDSPTKGSPEKSEFKSRIPSLERKSRRNKREDSTMSNISTSSSVSSINSVVVANSKDEKEKKSLKKVSLAVVKQRRKETGTSELLKTLDEYVS